MTTWYAYVAACADNSYYAGVTTDPKAREKKHNDGSASKYTRSRRPIKIIYIENHQSRSCALKREAQIKGWTRTKKQSLIQGNFPPLCESHAKKDHKKH